VSTVQGRRPPQYLKGFMMTRHIRSSWLETRAARLKLAIAKKPHKGPALAPGIHLDYRRNRGAGSWIVRTANGSGGYWTKAFALADDYEDADGDRILTFWQAQHRARAVARGENGASGRPFEDARRKFLAFIEQDIEPACYLYRHYHPSGDLLYVGISAVPVGRQLVHLKGAGWRLAIHQIVVEPFATREEALAAEQLAIETEFPKFNTVHNRRRLPVLEVTRALAPARAAASAAPSSSSSRDG
jgi:hypothetical protein